MLPEGSPSGRQPVRDSEKIASAFSPSPVSPQGAAEIVMGMCASMVDQSGAVVPLTPERVQKIKDTIKLMASQCLSTQPIPNPLAIVG